MLMQQVSRVIEEGPEDSGSDTDTDDAYSAEEHEEVEVERRTRRRDLARYARDIPDPLLGNADGAAGA